MNRAGFSSSWNATMRWDSPIFCGQHGTWYWALCRENVRGLPRFVNEVFAGQRLGIATFDSGNIQPTPEELALGWHVVDRVMLSPPLSAGLEIPCDCYDEWYVFERLPSSLPALERFVGIGGFNLADPRQLAESFEPTWERSGLDWLYPVQKCFWKQMDDIQPMAYIGSGDDDVIVCREQRIIDEFLRIAAIEASGRL
ncbi:hypothetical protein [Planctellipticum variicoloris]|uniref:hypothetical protein n=1 Tax=Planctellipticum variicoloris TaxID=3064265 RepID=UPI0030133A13|nr:hypothetical protein SH412_003803 [Planctomycetaceae bacterium SH412]